jgi:hypothetical protein
MKKTLVNKVYIRSNDIKQVALSYIGPLISLIGGDQVNLSITRKEGTHYFTGRYESERNEILNRISAQNNSIQYGIGWYPAWPSERMNIEVSSLIHGGRGLPPGIQKTMSEENIADQGEQVICCEISRQFDNEEAWIQEKAEYLKEHLIHLEGFYHCIYGFVHCFDGFVDSPPQYAACTRMSLSNTYLFLNGYAMMECYTEGGFWLNLFSPCLIRRIGGLEAFNGFCRESDSQVTASGNVFFQVGPGIFIPEDTVLLLEAVLKKTLLKIAQGTLRDYSAQVINSVAPGALNKVKNLNVIKRVFIHSVEKLFWEIRRDAIERMLVSKGEGHINGSKYEHSTYTPETAFTEMFEQLPVLVALLKKCFGERTIAGMTWEELCRRKLSENVWIMQGKSLDANDSIENELFYKHAEAAAEKAIKKLDPRIKPVLNEYPDVDFLFTFNAPPDASKLKELDSAIKALAEKSVSSGEQSGVADFIDDITAGEDGTQCTLYADMGTVAVDDFLVFCSGILKICDKLHMDIKEMTIT